MITENDWLMRQIQQFILVAAQLLFGKGTVKYVTSDEQTDIQTDRLYRKLTDLVAQRKLCEAENLLFDELDETDTSQLALAIDFYQALNALTDDELESNGFSRDEIFEGLHDAMDLFNVEIPGFTR